MDRRRFLLAATAAPFAARAAASNPPLCIFSKHLQQFGYGELAKVTKDFGFDGIDLTVRPKGHVLPENVERDLPVALKAIRSRGLAVPMITTGLVTHEDPAAEPTLRTAGHLKVPFFKIGYSRYRDAHVLDKLAEVKKGTAGLAALGKKHKIAAGFHNHSGDYVGVAVWDTREMIRDLDPQWIGYYFDPCHATAEGGKAGWHLALDIALPRLKMIALKDFYWKKDEKGVWQMTMCPLGEGMVNWDRFFATIAKAKFTGPLSLHVEYHTDNEMKAIAADLAFMRKMVAKHYA
jgi:sugar phosphate isomerase/epimerase